MQILSTMTIFLYYKLEEKEIIPLVRKLLCIAVITGTTNYLVIQMFYNIKSNYKQIKSNTCSSLINKKSCNHC